MLAQVTVACYAICLAAYLLLSGLLIASRAQHRFKALLLTTCLATMAWAAAIIATQEISGLPTILPLLHETLGQLRSMAWMALVAFVLFVAYPKQVNGPAAAGLGVGFAAIIVFALGAPFVRMWTVDPTLTDPRLPFVANIMMAVAGLLLVENLFRSSGREARWVVKYLCFGAGTVFAYDLFVSAEAALFGRPDDVFFAARGIIATIVVPFILIAGARSKKWPIDLHVSRRLAFHSATLMVGGAYLVTMAAVGYYLRIASILSSDWGAILQIGFVAAAILVLAAVLSSGSVQARIKDFINRNFFSYRYDYRLEWPRFIAAISDSLTELTIPERIVRALANLVEGTEGALWVHREEDDAYHLAATWNMPDVLPGVAALDPFVGALAGQQGIVNVADQTIDGAPAELSIPRWLSADHDIWLIVPLMHVHGLIGFVAIGRARAPRDLGWEDFELLKTAGRQAGSYLAEENMARSLSRARRFEDFNRQFSFVVHDIKNLVGQMTLILKNAERHGDKPEFQAAVLATVKDSVVHLRTLLDQLRGAVSMSTPAARFDFAALLRPIIQNWGLQIPHLKFEAPMEPVDIVGDTRRIGAVVNHLIQNAFDAAGADGQVIVTLEKQIEMAVDPARGRRMWAILTVADDGPGMDPKFIEEKLFQPLEGTSLKGFGLGAFQVRQIVRELGGRLEVDSQVGAGTRMIIHFPVAAELAAQETNDKTSTDETAGIPTERAAYG